MYEKPLEEKLDELIGLVRAIDTKIMFLEQDLAELKESILGIGETVVDTAIQIRTNPNSSSGDSDKKARLEEFQRETARW